MDRRARERGSPELQFSIHQEVFRTAGGGAAHTSPSTAILTVLERSGYVHGGDSERKAQPGKLVVFAPREAHGMHAVDEHFVLLALMAPRPGTRRAGKAGQRIIRCPSPLVRSVRCCTAARSEVSLPMMVTLRRARVTPV